MTPMHPRCLRDRLVRALGRHPVVVLLGARRVGKTALVRALARRRGASYHDLAHPETQARARRGLEAFVGGLRLPAVLDGLEHLPGLAHAVRRRAEAGLPAGSVLVTAGSVPAALARLIRSPQARAAVLTLHPLSLAERGGACFDLFERLAEPPSGPPPESWEAAYRAGGLPELKDLARDDREEWWRTYLSVLGGRARTKEAERERPLLALLAREGPALLNKTRWAQELGRSYLGLERALDRLEGRGWLLRLPAWAPAGFKGLARQPRLALFDTGLAGHLTGTRYPGWRERAFRLFVLLELLRHAGFAGLRPYHLRSYAGRAVDLLLKRPDGRLLAFALSPARRPAEADLGGLGWLRNRLGERLAAGYLIHAGEEAGAVAGFPAVPFRVLWP